MQNLEQENKLTSILTTKYDYKYKDIPKRWSGVEYILTLNDSPVFKFVSIFFPFFLTHLSVLYMHVF